MSIEFEKDVRLSKSLIWDMQKEYFASTGIDAWNHQVPFYITSNPVIAKHYASLVYAMMLDNYDINKSDVYYIIPLLLKRDDYDDNSTQRTTLIRLIVVLITPLLFVAYFYSLLSYSRVLF